MQSSLKEISSKDLGLFRLQDDFEFWVLGIQPFSAFLWVLVQNFEFWVILFNVCRVQIFGPILLWFNNPSLDQFVVHLLRVSSILDMIMTATYKAMKKKILKNLLKKGWKRIISQGWKKIISKKLQKNNQQKAGRVAWLKTWLKKKLVGRVKKIFVVGSFFWVVYFLTVYVG